MAIAFRSGTSAGTGAATNLFTFNITKPTGTSSGDLLLLYTMIRGVNQITAPTGFTACTGTSFSSAWGQLFWRVADGSEGSTFAVTWPTASSTAAAVCLAYSGVANAAPFDPATPADGGAATTGTFSEVGPTTTTANTVLVWMAGEKNAVSGAVPGTFGLPAGFTSRVAQYSTASTNPNIAVIAADKANAATGATGTFTATDSLATDHDMALVAALRAAPPTVVNSPVWRMQAVHRATEW